MNPHIKNNVVTTINGPRKELELDFMVAKKQHYRTLWQKKSF